MWTDFGKRVARAPQNLWRRLPPRVLSQSALLRRLLVGHYLRRRFRAAAGRPLNTASPHGFTEKLFVQMLATNRFCDPVQTRLADKLRVRDYVAERIGERYLARLLWHGDEPNNIPFDRLRPPYVVKTNHASGNTIIVAGEPDRAAIAAAMRRAMDRNFYFAYGEAQYLNIPPQVMIEAFHGGDPSVELFDHRYYCFDGQPTVIRIDTYDQQTTNSFYDPAWRKLDLHTQPDMERPDIPRPANLDEMNEIASVLSRSFGFVRVDLYNIAGAVYFGEMTFTPGGGEARYQPDPWDAILGERWQTIGNRFN